MNKSPTGPQRSSTLTMLAFKSNTKEECIQMPSKIGQISSSAIVRAGRRGDERPKPVSGFYAIEKNDIIHGHQFFELHGRPRAAGARGRCTMKMAASRHFFPLLLAIFILAIAPASAVNAANPDIGRAGGAERPLSSELAGGWHFVRTPNPQWRRRCHFHHAYGRYVEVRPRPCRPHDPLQ